MRKIFALAIVFITLILVGCNLKPSDEKTTETIDISVNPVPSTSTDFSIKTTGTIPEEYVKFSELDPEDPESLIFYRKMVQSRLSEKRYLLTEEEGYLLLEEGYSIGDLYIEKKDSKMYFPIIFSFKNATVLWWTTEYGNVYTEIIRGNLPTWNNNFIGYLALAYDTDEQILEKELYHALTYNKKTSKISYWEFGKVIDTISLPDGSTYAGHSFFEGYLFRNSTDIIAYGGWYSQYPETEVLREIAHNVAYVIEADYSHSSDAWSQPLFLMTDGSIKAFVSWMQPQLVDIQYEGGYPHR